MTTLRTPKFRVAFPHVFEKQKPMNGEGEGKYSIAMLFDLEEIAKDPEEQAKWDAMVQAVADAMKSKWGDNIPPRARKPFLKGDDQLNKEGQVYEGYAGKVLVRAGTKFQPIVYDQAVNVIEDADKFYGGCYAIADINTYAYSVSGNMGVSFGLFKQIQKVAEGERLGGSGGGGSTDFKPIAGTMEAPAEEAQSATTDDLFN